MKKFTKLQFEEYDNDEYKPDDIKYKNYDRYIGGTMSKRFIRLDSSELKGFFSAKRHKNNSYVSCLDDFIAENMQDTNKDIPIKYVSVLLKRQRTSEDFEHVSKDVVGSRLANLFGVPTVYNDFACDNSGYENEYYLISVDFVKNGQTIDNFEDTDDRHTNLDSFSSFEDWERYVRKRLTEIMAEDEIKEMHKNPNYICRTEEEKETIINNFLNEFVEHYIFRILIVDDMDFKPRNITYIKEEDNGKLNYILAPANDFEFVCSFRRQDLMESNVSESLEYLCAKYPQVTANFMERLKKRIIKNGHVNETKIDNIFDSVMKHRDYYKYMSSRLSLNIDKVIETYDTIFQKSLGGNGIVD